MYIFNTRSNCLGTNKALQRENSKIPARNCGKYRCYLRGKQEKRNKFGQLSHRFYGPLGTNFSYQRIIINSTRNHITKFFFINFKYTKDAPEDQWTKASIGITNSGGIRAGLQKGNISFADMYGVLPFGNSIDRITIKGLSLRKTLEISAAKFSLDGENEGVGFPQV